MDYIALGSWFLNDIDFPDGRRKRGLMGGCGMFACCGMLQYTPSALFLGGMGTDMEEKFGAFLDRNHIDRRGFLIYPHRTKAALLGYDADGRWYNKKISHGPRGSGREDYSPEIFERLGWLLSGGGTKGIYMEELLRNGATHRRMRQLRERYGVKVMWELIPGDCRPENLDDLVEKALPCYDIYSLNRRESYALFSVSSEEEAIRRILEIGKPCFFRVGSKGSYMIRDGHAAFVPAVSLVPREREVDPTGCGNCSTGAALWAFCEGYGDYETAALANVAAAYNVLQYGPYPVFDREIRRAALERGLALAAAAREAAGS